MKSIFRLNPIHCLVLAALAPHAYAQSDDTAATERITVFGQGQTRQVQNITQDDIAKALPGESPLMLLEKLPGVHFQSADAYGAYEWSTRLSVRGFNQNYMGFTLDDIPLGDMSYGNNNGLHISRAIASENLGRVVLSQGAGAVGTASTSNLGGTVQFYSADPEEAMGGRAAQTAGSDSTYRTFLRFDTGRLESGTKAYFSLVHQTADKWKGWGPQDQDQFNAKLVHSFGDNRLSLTYDYSDRKETDYQDLSIDMQKRLGWGWDNYAPDWQRAVNAAKGTFTGGVNSLDDAYYLGRGLRRDHLFGAALDLSLSEHTELKTTAYYHHNDGQGHWYTPYVPTDANDPISLRTTEYQIGRSGVVSALTWTGGAHSVNGGLWAERSLHTLTRNYYAVTGPQDTNHFLSDPMATQFKQDFTTTTTQFHLQDTVTLVDGRLTANFGFKSPRVTIDASDVVGTRAQGNITAKKTFLPQVGVDYKLDPATEIFASVTDNMRAYQPGVSGPFSQTQTAFDLGTPNLKPETSTTVDLGARFKSQQIQGSVALYHVDFKDRLLSVAACAGIVGCPSTFVNVGKVQSNGLEAAAVVTLAADWSWFNAYTYDNAQYKSNYTDNNVVVAVSGKQVVDTPKNMFTTELTYDNGTWFARLNGKYTDKRYYTYSNDNSVDSFWLWNLGAGYKQKSLAGLKDFSAQVSLTNLANKHYFSTIGTNGFVSSDPTGLFATMMEGAPRQVFFTISAKI